jgi:NAD(P)-dependent dehydrogenase (short-subunit alcohol dehydrogenase family)
MNLTDRSSARYDGAIAATVSGVLDRVRNRGAALSLTEADRLDGRTCLVTGANRGLGLAVAHHLAERGANLVLACRSGLDQAVASVRAKTPREVRGVHLDLADLQSVEACVTELCAGDPLQVVVLNAGIVPREARRTADGFDESFQVNFLSNYLFARRLIEAGRLATKGPGIPRLVFVSSESHRSSPPIEWSSLGAFKPWGIRQAVEQYGYGKLLLQTFAEELARRERGKVAVHSLCPGAVRTDIGREAPGWVKPLLDVTMRAFFQSPAKAALPVVYLAASRVVESESGVYLHATRRRSPSDAALDPEAGRRLWDKAERILAESGHPLGDARP